MRRFVLVGLLAIATLAVPSTGALASTPQAKNFVAHLNSGQEINVIVPTAAQGEAIFHLNADGSVSFRVIVANITGVTMAHIHVAPRGKNGPIKQWLFPVSGPPPASPSGRIDGILAEGTFMPSAALLEAIRSGDAYVNVHTKVNPGGEIRGQIRQAGPSL